MLRWKGCDFEARIVVKGYDQHMLDKDDVYASTPQRISLKVPLVFALARNYRILFGAVSTADLRGELQTTEEILVEPPLEYHPNQDVIWRLKRPLYGLRTPPRDLQDFFAGVLKDLGGQRSK